MSEWVDIVASILLLIGLAFTLFGSIGLVRLPDFYTRMHAPTKATTLGVNAILAAAALTLPGHAFETALKATLVIVFLFLTAPIGAHMLAKAARQLRVPPVRGTVDEISRHSAARSGQSGAGDR